MMNAHNAQHFEATVVRDGLDVDVMLKRRGLPITAHLTPRERKAVEIYAAAFEAVSAGGAVMPRDSLAGGVGGGSGGPSREGRQSQVVDQAAALRRMAQAVRARPVLVFGKRKPVEVTPLAIWHGFVVDGLHVRQALARHGLPVGGSNLARATDALLSEVRAQTAAVLDALGLGANPFAG